MPDTVQLISLYATSGHCVLDVSYSDVQGGEEDVELVGDSDVSWLDGNIDQNPLFADKLQNPKYKTWNVFVSRG